jgi:hypothetical protein
MTGCGVPILSSVAFVIDLPEARLTRGQIGTVVQHLESGGERAELVEFANEDGEAMQWFR